MGAQPASSGGGDERLRWKVRSQAAARDAMGESGVRRCACRPSVLRPRLAVGGGGTSPLHAGRCAEEGGAFEA